MNAMRKAKTKTKVKIKRTITKKETHTVLVNVKMTPRERTALQRKADRYTDGNISAWLRLSALRYALAKELAA
jgi:hypothetical protein